MPCSVCNGTGIVDEGLRSFNFMQEIHSSFRFKGPEPVYQEMIVDCRECLGTGLGKEEALALARHIIDTRVAEALNKEINEKHIV